MQEKKIIDGKLMCSRCKNMLPVSSFRNSNILKCGKWHQCYRCEKEYKTEWYSRGGREKKNRSSLAWTNNNFEKYLLTQSRSNAKKKGLAHNIDITDIRIPHECPLLGIKLIRSCGKLSDNSPSLDRIDSAKGYIKGNVKVVSYLANRIKTNATPSQIKTVASNIDVYVKS